MTFQVASLPAVLRDRLKTPFSQIENFCQQWNIQEFALFGSVIRDDFGSDSDIDVLIELNTGANIGLFDIVQMKEELTQLFGRSVDVTQKKLLKNPFSKAEILSTHRVIYPHENANFTGIIPADTLMTENVRDNASLFDIVKAAQAIKRFLLEKTFEDYLSDELLQSAVERNLAILGQKVTRLSVSFQSRYPELDYGNIVDVGNAVVYQYYEPNHARDWDVATRDVPSLLEQVQPLAPELPSEDQSTND